MRRNPIFNSNLSNKTLSGDHRLIKAQVYAQVYLIASQMQNRIINLNDATVDSIIEGNTRVLATEVVRETSMAVAIPVSRRQGAGGLSGWFGNRHEEMVTIALQDVVQDTKDELVGSIKDSLNSRNIVIDDRVVCSRAKQILRDINENVIVSVFNSEIDGAAKIHSSNYYSRGIDGRIKPHEISDKAVVFEKHSDLMIVPSHQRPLTMSHTSDFGYIGVGLILLIQVDL